MEGAALTEHWWVDASVAVLGEVDYCKVITQYYQNRRLTIQRVDRWSNREVGLNVINAGQSCVQIAEQVKAPVTRNG